MTQTIRLQFQLNGPEGEQQLVAEEGVTTIGRQKSNDWHLAAAQVSRQHARLDCTRNACQITDLGSANGTYVNGEKLTPGEPRVLQAQDVIQIGPYELVYSPVTVAEEPPETREGLEQLEDEAGAPPTGKQQVARDLEVVEVEKEAPALAPSDGHEDGREPTLKLPPGLSTEHSLYLQYLPGLYHTPFMNRFLALFESILAPIEWTVDNFDLFLSPSTVPEGFLPWLGNLFELTFDDSWSEASRRALLAEAADLFARRGTQGALARTLEIYLGVEVDVDDKSESLAPFTFTVTLPVSPDAVNVALLEQLVEAQKPAHTQYELQFK